MAEHHPVTFQYLDYHYGKGQILKHDGFRYILHPFALVWNNGFYYCIGTCPEQKPQEPDKIIHFRIDRMKGVSIKEDTVLVKPPKGFSVAKHMESSFSMYGNRSETVQIRFKKELLTQFFDRFEQTVHVFEDTDHEGYLLANVEVSVSPTFFSWVSQYGGGFTIAGPDRVRRLYHEHLEEALKA